MSTQKTFRLDGKKIPFKDGDTVMDAALRAGEYIPHLCHNPDFPPHGSCRVCVVVVNGKHACSCTLPATEDMDVDNSSEAIVDKRRTLLQMLFGQVDIGAKTRRDLACLIRASRIYHGDFVEQRIAILKFGLQDDNLFTDCGLFIIGR